MRLRTALQIVPLLLVLTSGVAMSQGDAPAAPSDIVPASAAQSAASDGKSLQAIFLEVVGKVRWRAGEAQPWKEAAVNDLVSQGAEIRTGLKSRAALRVGKNATVLVDAGTSFQLPAVVEEGQTLRTVASVKNGRVDFKVDKVGFANDFKVVTPQTTLSVRGTGFGMTYGALAGAEVTGARTNEINAIELRYVSSNLKYFLSGSAQSSSNRPDPVQNAWLGTLGPPQIAGLIADGSQLQQAAAQGQTGNNPVNPQQYQQQAAAESTTDSGDAGQITSLLSLQSDASEAVRSRSLLALQRAAAAGSSADAALSHGNSRQAAIAAVLAAARDLDGAWSQDGGPPALLPFAQSQLQELKSQSAADIGNMASLRAQMNQATGRDATSEVRTALQAMATINDGWRSSLGAQARDVLDRVAGLNDTLQAAMGTATTSNDRFNALLGDARDRQAVADAAVTGLSDLQQKVSEYQASVAQLIAKGAVSVEAAAQLQRSVDLMRQSQASAAEAVAAVQSASSQLARAQALASGTTMGTALAAARRGSDILAQATGLKQDVDDHMAAIDATRFGAYEDAVTAGVASVRLRSESVHNQAQQGAADAALALDAANSRQTAIENALRSGASIESTWTASVGGGGTSPMPSRQEQMTIWRNVSASDEQTRMPQLRAQMDAAIARDAPADVSRALDQMGAVDDKWQLNIKGQVRNVVTALMNLNDTLQGRKSLAQSANTNFNALYATAESGQSVTQAAFNAMQSLHDAVKGYRDTVTGAVAAGWVTGESARQLQRAADLLAQSETRVASTLSAVQSVSAQLAQARTVSQRVLLSAALLAAARGDAIVSEATGLKAEIEGHMAAIESARFSAFYAAVASGVATIRESGPDVQTQAASTQSELLPLGEMATTIDQQSQQVIGLAMDMDTFWNVGRGDSVSPRMRLTNLQGQSAIDRQSMASMLTSLRESIGAEDPSGAQLTLSDMVSLDRTWNGPSVSLLAEAESVHTQMTSRMAAIDAALNNASDSNRNYKGILTQAQQKLDATSAAADHLTDIHDRLLAYQQQYQQLVQQGRGGTAGAQQVANAASDLQGILSAYNAARNSADAAAAAVADARSNGERVLFAQAATKRADAAQRLLGESTLLINAIRTNAQAIHADYVTGQTEFDTAFGGRGPGSH